MTTGTRIYMFGVIVMVAAVALIGCSNGGVFAGANLTDVQLQRNNFKIVAKDVSGEAQAGYLFGITWSGGMYSNTLALFRVSGTGLLYKEAFADLWKNYEAAHGPVGDKKIAFINLRYDSDALNLFLFTQAKIMIRADVIEFTER
jgi:hypothetical protein